MTFEEIVDFTIEKYSNEKGKDKLHSVYEKTMTSSRLSSLISISKYKMLAPSATDVFSNLNVMPFFLLRSNWTQVCAAILFYKRWNEEVNNALYILNPEQLKQRAISCYNMYEI